MCRPQAEFLSEAVRAAPPGWQPPAPPRLPTAPAELRQSPPAVAALLTGRLAALPSVGGKRKRDCGRPPSELAAALRAAAEASPASVPPEEVWGVLEEVGACLESAADRTQAGQAEPLSADGGAESLIGPLEQTLALPLEHLSEPAVCLLLPALCLCLLRTRPGDRARRLALCALTALLESEACEPPLQRLQPGRLLSWLASAPPCLPSAELSNGSAVHDDTETMEDVLDSEDGEALLGLSSSPTKRRYRGPKCPKSPEKRSPCDNNISIDSDPKDDITSDFGGGCAVASARHAVLGRCAGRRAVRLADPADRLMERAQRQDSAEPGLVDALLELLQHFVQVGTQIVQRALCLCGRDGRR